MKINSIDSLKTLSEFEAYDVKYKYFDLNQAAAKLKLDLNKLPFSLRILLEMALRNEDGKNVNENTFHAFKEWLIKGKSEAEVPYQPARVLMQDFTGVPALVDLAAMRDAAIELGKEVENVNPLIPVDLVIDHSVQVDSYANNNSFKHNVHFEMTRNQERYEFLKWGQKAFDNFKVVPPGTGICHQVNLEYLSTVAFVHDEGNVKYIFPDSLVGTDSHTTMVNGLAVLGWGVGGIEAEAAMLGQSLSMVLPEVIGVKLTGKLQEGSTATDLVLTITEMLRKKGVVGKFVEFFGPGLDELTLADRATIANMAPEYGATCGFFPVDDETINYLRLTARDRRHVKLVERYCKMQNMWRNSDAVDPVYTDKLILDLTTIEPSLAGPRRPQDRIALSAASEAFKKDLPDLSRNQHQYSKEEFKVTNRDFPISNGDVVIAAITSCTNTSNPSVMIAAGLVAKKARELGISKKPWVKTSLAPGSKVVTEYLKDNDLNDYLDELGFNLVGYGCTTCIGNSGPLDSNIEETITNNNLVVASVLSGNRNFEGRIHPLVRANYLASPPLVVIYAIAGSMDIDVFDDPIAQDSQGRDIYMKDLWPSKEEINACIQKTITPEIFSRKYADVFDGTEEWQNLKSSDSSTYLWNPLSTYINNPPYFEGMTPSQDEIKNIKGAKLLAMFGDSITTDHISPAGNIAKNSPAAQYLLDHNINISDFNSYGSRRGNHEVMMRGTFANIRIRNELCPQTEGGVTKYQPTGEEMTIYDASIKYQEQQIPLIIIAGKEYGSGSSRDWAAKGTKLLGVKAVIAESFERIHRSNLVGMGVMPFTFTNNITRADLNIKGDEEFSIIGIEDGLKTNMLAKLFVKRQDGEQSEYDIKLNVSTDQEIEYIKNDSVLHKVLRDM